MWECKDTYKRAGHPDERENRIKIRRGILMEGNMLKTIKHKKDR